MTRGWISKLIEKATGPGFVIILVLLFAYSFWAFNLDSPWTRALEGAGGILPETKPGIPAIEPVRSLDEMTASKTISDYLLWQALDFPYAALNFFFAALGMGLGLKALKLDRSALRFLLLLPAIYVACEIVENAMLTGFATGLLPTTETIVLFQQFATTLKFASGMPAPLLGLLGAVIALAANLIGRFKKRA